MKVEVYTLNAFSEESGGGNPAGVVLEADHLSESQMLEIANIVGFSETAFVLRSNKADFRVRFFTPTEEVDLCGHATIATFYLLDYLDVLQEGKYRQETKAGVLSVTIESDGLITMEQATPKFNEKLTTRDKRFLQVCRSLGIEEGDVGVHPIIKDQEQPFFVNHMEIVSTGLRDLIVPVRSIEILNSLKPEMDLITEISRMQDITGYHVFAMDRANSTAQCRNFAPAVGIDEESATGSSSGALGCFLIKNKIINEDKKNISMIFNQGLIMERPSKIYVNIIKEAAWGNRVEKVFVGGKADNVKKMEVSL
ncbi:MAG: PhzF family phenazine biosynthesis protein [Peptostreptococcaceae bacterium]|nr:PhzF family phenazine biosynthesis protein [Peptostreptococcaceae bacterium]